MYDWAFFTAFSTSAIAIPISEREGALLASALLLLEQSRFDPTTDDPDARDAAFADLIEKLSP